MLRPRKVQMKLKVKSLPKAAACTRPVDACFSMPAHHKQKGGSSARKMMSASVGKKAETKDVACGPSQFRTSSRKGKYL